MAESYEHMAYVNSLQEYVKMLLPESEYLYVRVDSPYEIETPPQIINNFRPDVYYCHNDFLIIGEAKTDDDFCRSHSLEQYRSYLTECNNYNGKSLLVLSGSWRISPAFANLIRNLQMQNGIHCRVVIINELGVYKDIK